VSRPDRAHHATEAGTRAFRERHAAGKADDAYTLAGRLTLSSLGLGTYLGRPDDDTDARYEEAIAAAIRGGVNVLDTAANYRQRRSERLIGRALRRLFDAGEVSRSELLIASKAGFVPMDAQQPKDPLAFFRGRTVGRGLARDDELRCGCHCIAPRYLRATLEESLHDLGLATLDVFFVHNPESQLQELDRPAFIERMRRAFEALERAGDDGLLRAYGVATWPGLRAARQDRDYLSLRELWALAEEVGGARHRFRAIEVPFNLLLPEAHCLANQDGRAGEAPLLHVARELGLLVLGSAALGQGRLARLDAAARLPEGHGAPEGADARVHAALQFARSAPGVSAALVGMARTEHVAQNLRTLAVRRAPRDWVDAVTAPRGASFGG
jgi:aryl-alcohol dehydrogenase-like predicted oxidoreductase